MGHWDDVGSPGGIIIQRLRANILQYTHFAFDLSSLLTLKTLDVTANLLFQVFLFFFLYALNFTEGVEIMADFLSLQLCLNKTGNRTEVFDVKLY